MRSTTMMLLFAKILCVSSGSRADGDFHGIVESRPSGLAGSWTIGGCSLQVTESAELEEDHGLAAVGACVSVDFEGSVVEEIETEEPSKCGAR